MSPGAQATTSSNTMNNFHLDQAVQTSRHCRYYLLPLLDLKNGAIPVSVCEAIVVSVEKGNLTYPLSNRSLPRVEDGIPSSYSPAQSGTLRSRISTRQLYDNRN